METKTLCRFRSFSLAKSPHVYSYLMEFRNAPINNPDFLSSEFASHIGKFRQKDFANDTAFGYNKVVGQNEPENTSIDIDATAFAITDRINELFSFLWFVKDCASHLHETIFYTPINDTSFIVSNHEIYSNTAGKQEPETFTSIEIDEAINLRNLYQANVSKTGKMFSVEQGLSILDVAKDMLNFSPYNKMSRIERAMTFLNFARKQTFVPMKISMYVPIYECLFAENEQEISHKVSERCACYVGGTREEKLSNFQLVREAYDVRSKILHGDVLKSKHNDKGAQIELCKKIDNLTRHVLKRVITADYKVFLTDKMKPFYDGLLFQ